MAAEVLLVEIGEIPPGLAEAVALRAGRELGLAVRCAGSRLDPAEAYDRRRDQFLAARLLESLRRIGDGRSRVVGLASVDLFNPILTFVFGEAEMPGRAAVFSIHRLREEFYGLPPNPGLLADRAVKEFLHELGHTFGLAHCPDYACAMSAAHSVERVDLKRGSFCADCAPRLKTTSSC